MLKVYAQGTEHGIVITPSIHGGLVILELAEYQKLTEQLRLLKLALVELARQKPDRNTLLNLADELENNKLP